MSNDPSKTKVDWTEVNNVKVTNSIIDLTAKRNLKDYKERRMSKSKWVKIDDFIYELIDNDNIRMAILHYNDTIRFWEIDLDEVNVTLIVDVENKEDTGELLYQATERLSKYYCAVIRDALIMEGKLPELDKTNNTKYVTVEEIVESI